MKSLATLPHNGMADSVGTVLVGPERADSNLGLGSSPLRINPPFVIRRHRSCKDYQPGLRQKTYWKQ